MKAPQRLTVAPEQVQAQQLQLTPEQQHYLRRVLRLKPGAAFVAQDGQGNQWQAQLMSDARQATVIALPPVPPPPVPLTLAAALPKTGFDEVVRQVSELGATAIQPLISDRTLLDPSPSKQSRWQRIAQEASEQCERSWVPVVYAPASYADWILSRSTQQKTYLCAERSQTDLLVAHIQRDWPFAAAGVAVVIGPEGGWTDGEISVALDAHCQPVSLGSAVLRAKTAAIAAVSILSMMIEQLI